MDILIMGIGGLGGVFSGELIRNGYNPTLVTHNPNITQAINTNGIQLTTPQEEGVVIPATAYTAVAEIPEESRFDSVWLITKVDGVFDAVRASMVHLKPDGFMACFQNGLVEDAIIEILGDPSRVISVSVAFGGTMEAPGVYRRTTDGAVFVGELDGRITERIRQMQTLLGYTIETHISDNIIGQLWSKLCWNASVSGLGAILGKNYGEIACEYEGRELLLRSYREVMDTARSHGITLATHVVGPVTALYMPEDADETIRQEKHQLLIDMMDTFAAVKPSSLQSLERGRKTETEYLNGHVIRKAAQTGIPVPLNEVIAEMIAEIENGQRKISADNIHDLQHKLNARLSG